MPSVAALLLACSGYDVYLYAHVLYVQAQRAQPRVSCVPCNSNSNSN
jgi:hypothetical protein